MRRHFNQINQMLRANFNSEAGKSCCIQPKHGIDNEENTINFIKDVVNCQVHELQTRERAAKSSKSWNFILDTSKLPTLVLDGLNEASVAEEVKLLHEAVETLISEGVVVTSQETGELVPPSYEVLTFLFRRTSEEFRLKHFHKLINLYYNELKNGLQSQLSDVYSQKLAFDLEVKILLPVVKLDIVLQKGASGALSEVGNSLRRFFLYPRLNQEDIYLVVRNKIGSFEFNLKNYQLIPLDAKNGHLGEYFKLNIDIKQQGKESNLKLFAKFLTPKAEFMKEILKLGPSMKEDWFYFGYLPKLREIGLSDLLSFAPNCYFSRINDVIILDDLSKVGYTGLTPNTKLEYNALKMVVRELANLHSCSLILEEELSKSAGKDVRLSDMYGEYLQEVLFGKDTPYIKSIDGMVVNTVMYFISTFSYANGHSNEKIKEQVDSFYNSVFDKVKPSSKYRNVICHGDAYVANMLFKFNEQTNCEDVKLIDFQLLRYCPPTQDLLFFLIQNATKENLDRHFNNLVDEYYTSLSESLQKYSIDINEIYPRETFDECLLYMKGGAIMQAFFYSPFQSLDPKVREKISGDDDEIEKIKTDSLYIVKMGMQDDYYAHVMRGLTQQFVDLIL